MDILLASRLRFLGVCDESFWVNFWELKINLTRDAASTPGGTDGLGSIWNANSHGRIGI